MPRAKKLMLFELEQRVRQDGWHVVAHDFDALPAKVMSAYLQNDKLVVTTATKQYVVPVDRAYETSPGRLSFRVAQLRPHQASQADGGGTTREVTRVVTIFKLANRSIRDAAKAAARQLKSEATEQLAADLEAAS
jgi:hypothetical protein